MYLKGLPFRILTGRCFAFCSLNGFAWMCRAGPLKLGFPIAPVCNGRFRSWTVQGLKCWPGASPGATEEKIGATHLTRIGDRGILVTFDYTGNISWVFMCTVPSLFLLGTLFVHVNAHLWLQKATCKNRLIQHKHAQTFHASGPLHQKAFALTFFFRNAPRKRSSQERFHRWPPTLDFRARQDGV